MQQLEKEDKPHQQQHGSNIQEVPLFPTYKKRPGTNDAGKEYEYMMCALYAVKLATNDTVSDFEMTTNDQRYGDFDDVSLKVTFTDQITKHFLVQLKHLEDAKKNITVTDFSSSGSRFSMVKYLKSYEEIEAGDASVILYTNRQTKMRKGFKFNIRPDETEEYSLEATVEEDNDSSMDVLINSHTKKRNIFQFGLDENVPKFAKIGKFSQNFYFFASQDGISAVRSSLRQILATLLQQDIYDSFVSFIRSWWLGWFVLNKHDTIAKLTQVALSPWTKTLSGDKANSKTQHLTKTMLDFEMTLVHGSGDSTVADIWEPENQKNLVTVVKKYEVAEKDTSLWYLGKVPLVVTVDERNTQRVRRATDLLRRSVKNKKVVLVGDAKRKEYQNWDVFSTLEDLKRGKVYDEVVNTFRVSLQGRPSIFLHELLKDQEMGHTIGTAELLKMSQEEYLLGSAEEQVNSLEAYIPRTVSRILLDTKKTLDYCINSKNTVLVVNCADASKDMYFNNVTTTDLDTFMQLDARTRISNLPNTVLLSASKKSTLSHFKTLVIYSHFKNLNVFLIQILNDKHCTILLKHENDSSFPSDTQLEAERAFVKEEDIFSCFNDSLTVLCALPGMGKTTLFHVMSGVYCPPDIWAVYVSLISMNPFLQKKPSKKEILERILKPQSQIEEFLYKEKQFILFLDGLDEVNSASVDLVLDFIEYVLGQGIKVWLSSRENLHYKINESLHVVPIDIEKLKKEEQEKYIHERLKTKYASKEIEKIVTTVFTSTDVAKSQELLEIPLQLYIITELLLDNQEFYDSLSEENTFVLTKLYQIYFEGKKKFSFKKIGVDLQEEQIGYNFKHHLKQYEILGLKSCLDDSDFAKFGLDVNEHEDFVNQVKKRGDKFGIIRSIDDNDAIIFSHQTYAEYFSCAWFRSHLDKVHILRIQFFSKRYENLKLMFDIMMAEQSPLHLAVIYSNVEQFQKHVSELDVKDKSGRSALQLVCCYGVKLPQFIDFRNVFNRPRYDSEEYQEIFGHLICGDVLRCDVTFRFNCLDYSLNSRCLYPIDKMLAVKKVAFEDLSDAITSIFDWDTLAYYSAFLGYPHLLSEVLPRVNINDLKFGDYGLLGVAVIGNRHDNPSAPRQGNIVVANLLIKKGATLTYRDRNILDEACTNECYDMLSLLLIDHGLKCTEENNILHRIVPYGFLNQQVVDLERDVNARNKRGQTPLLLASEHGKIDNVKKLVELGADVNIVDDHDKNALHYAVQAGNNNIEMIKHLSGYKISLDAFDKSGQTPLQAACQSGQFENVKTLIELGASINIVDNHQNNLLYYASRSIRDNKEVITLLVDSGLAINNQSDDGKTPLHVASNQTGNVKTLLDFGAIVDIVDKQLNTPLHCAMSTSYNKSEIIDLMVTHGANINAQNASGCTPLSIACGYGQVDNIKKLMELGADSDIVDNNGDSALHRLLQSWLKETEVVHLFQGFDVNIINRKGQTPLQIACERGQVANVGKLLELGADVNHIDSQGNNLLHRLNLALRSDTEITKLLTKYGIDVNSQNKNGHTSLHIACKFDTETNIKLLLEQGADPNITNNQKYTALHYVLQSFNDKTKAIELLSSYGADLNSRNNEDKTPILSAIRFGSIENVKKLLELGASLTIPDDDLNTSVHYAVVALSRNAEMLSLVVSHGVDMDAKNKFGLTPLHIACRQGEVGCVKVLLSLGADTTVVDNEGRNVLHDAARATKRNLEIIDMLISHDFSVNASDNNGVTPLHSCLEKNQRDNMEELLKLGADVNIVDNEGHTAMHYAAKSETRNSAVLDLLVCHGLDVNARSRDGVVPLHLALEKGQVENVKKFLEIGADVFALDDEENNAMHWAAKSERRNTEVIDLIAGYGFDVNASNRNGKTPLYFAHEKLQKENVKKLVELGADSDVVVDNIDGVNSQNVEETPVVFSMLETALGIQIGTSPILENIFTKNMRK